MTQRELEKLPNGIHSCYIKLNSYDTDFCEGSMVTKVLINKEKEDWPLRINKEGSLFIDRGSSREYVGIKLGAIEKILPIQYLLTALKE